MFSYSKADKLSVQPYLIHILRRFVNLVLLLSVGLGSFVQADMAYIANSGSNNVSVIDSSTNSVVALIPVGTKPSSVVVNPSGTRAYVSNNGSNNVSVIDTNTNTMISTIPVGNKPNDIEINSAGTRVYVANYDSNSISVIDTNTNSVIATVSMIYAVDSVVGKPFDVVINPTGTRVYVAKQNNNYISVIDTNTNKVIDIVAVVGSTYSMAINPAGTRIYVANTTNYNAGHISIIDTSTNKVISTVKFDSILGYVSINPSGTRVYVTNSYIGQIKVMDTSNDSIVATIPMTSYGIAFNSAGTLAYMSQSNDISVIDTNTNSVVAKIVAGSNPVISGKIFRSTTDCNTVTEIPVAECKELLNFYNSTGGTNWINKTGWNVTNTPCSWFGITCSGGHVQQIELTGNGLKGSLPNLTLPYLEWLGLDNNQLTGSLPNFNLPYLKALGVGGTNQLTGTIPNLNLPNLQYLALDKNKLTGSIPNFNFPNIQGLQLNDNQLSGGVSNFNFPKLQMLMLHGNQLCGILPNFTAFNLSNLYTAKFNNNCGLYAADTAQETALNTKDAQWKTKNPSCPATPDPACTANFDVTVTKTGNGQVSGGGKQAVGATVKLTATPDANSIFTGWTPAPCAASFTMPANSLTCTASFSACAYTISPATKTHTADKETGTITITPSTTNCPAVIPTSDSEWLIITSINGNTVNYQVLANTATTARVGNLTAAGQKFTVTQAGVPLFKLTLLSLIGEATRKDKESNYTAGTPITLTATTEANAIFTGWTPAPCAASFAMPASNLTCTANFSTCSYTLDSTNKKHSAKAESGTIAVTTKNGCPVPAQSNVPWLKVAAPTANSVSYTLEANAGGERTGTLTIAGQAVTISQESAKYEVAVTKAGNGVINGGGAYSVGSPVTLTATVDANSLFIGWTPAPCAASFTMPANNLTCTATFSTCSYTLDSLKKSHTENSGEGSIAITTQAGCPITAKSEVPWMKTTVVGNAVNYTVDKNTDVERKGILSIVGQQVEITQAVGKVEVIVNKAGNGEGIMTGGGIYPVGAPVKLTATATAAKSTFVGWTGTAPCGASFTIPANSPNPLTCTANFSTCTYTLGGTSRIHSPIEETGSVIVTTENGCTIPVQSNVPWLTVTATTGNTVNYKVAANTTAAERKGSLTIAGQLFEITQPAIPLPTFKLTVNKGGSCTGIVTEENHKEGDTIALSTPSCANNTFAEWSPVSCATSFKMPASNLICTANFSACTYTLSTLKTAHSAKSETGNITVNTQGNCPITAQSYASWITITSPSANPVNYTVEPNTGTEQRVGTMTIAGQTVTVTQAIGETFSINVSVSGSGTGTVSGQGSYAKGTSVSLTATPASDATFISWSGDCVGTANPYKLTLDGNKNCSAIFNSEETYLVMTAGNASFSPATQTVKAGQTATFSITALGTPIKSVTGCNGVWNGSNSYTTGAITENCVITAITDGKHTVSASQSSHGKIAPDSRIVETEKSAYFTITPDDGYEIDTVTMLSGGCKGTQQGSEYIIATVTENCQIMPTFKPREYAITILGTPGRGSTEPGTLKVKHGESASFTTIAATGYEVGGVSGCNTTLQSENIYKTGTITSACDITVSFKKIGEYTITTKTTGKGSVSPQTISLERGTSAIFSLTPEEGYVVDTVSGCDGIQSAESYTTKAVTADCSIAVAFKIKQYTLQTEVRPKGAGTISLPSNTIEHGKTMDFTVIPTDGYEVELTRGCKGEQILPINSIYTTRPIVDNCTLLADLKLKKYEIKLTYQFKNSPTSVVNFDPIEHGQSTGFDILDVPNEEIESVIGCGGRLEGKHYTTAVITASCEMTVYYKASPQSQCTQYSSKADPQVNVPCVNLVNQGVVYTGQMKLIPAIPPSELSFEVLGDSLKPLDKITPTGYCAVFPADSQHPTRLRLNCVKIENEYYWAELDLIEDPSRLLFNLIDYGVMSK